MVVLRTVGPMFCGAANGYSETREPQAERRSRRLCLASGYTPIFFLKYSIVFTSPCSSFTFGSHPSSVRAFVMSG